MDWFSFLENGLFIQLNYLTSDFLSEPLVLAPSLFSGRPSLLPLSLFPSLPLPSSPSLTPPSLPLSLPLSLPQVSSQCRCVHGTQGENCGQCLPLFNDRPWQSANGPNEISNPTRYCRGNVHRQCAQYIHCLRSLKVICSVIECSGGVVKL